MASALAAYKLENSLNDETANGFNLTNTGGVTFVTSPSPPPGSTGGSYVAGNFTGAQRFDGPPGLVSAISIVSEITTQFRLYMNDVSAVSGQRIISFGGATNGISLAGSGGHPANVGKVEAVQGNTVVSTTTLLTGTWYDVAVTYSNTSLNNRLRLYINGILETEVSPVGAVICSAFALGNKEDGTRPLNGYIKDVQISLDERTTFPSFDQFSTNPSTPPYLGPRTLAPPFELNPDLHQDDLHIALNSDKSGRLDASINSEPLPGSSSGSIKTNPRYVSPDSFMDNILR